MIEEILLFILNTKRTPSDSLEEGKLNFDLKSKAENVLPFYDLHFKKLMHQTILLISRQPTVNCSESVLYSKRTTGSPLSSHIKTISVAFIGAEI